MTQGKGEELSSQNGTEPGFCSLVSVCVMETRAAAGSLQLNLKDSEMILNPEFSLEVIQNCGVMGRSHAIPVLFGDI